MATQMRRDTRDLPVAYRIVAAKVLLMWEDEQAPSSRVVRRRHEI